MQRDKTASETGQPHGQQRVVEEGIRTAEAAVEIGSGERKAAGMQRK